MAKKKMTFEEKLDEAIVKDATYEVPENWTWTYMNNIGEYINGKAFKPIDWDTKGLPIIRIQNLTGTNNEFNYFSGEIEEKYKIVNNDLLMAWSATLDAFLWNGNDAVLNQHIFKVRSLINKKYHYYLLKNTIQEMYSKTHGTGMVHITKGKFEKLEVPLPPLKEQQRIVDRIESLFEKLDKAKELIEEARDDFEKRKSAVLEKAFRGELTKEWRKESYINSNLMELLLNQNNKLKKNFTFSEATELFELPNQWNWIKLKDCCEKFKYGTSAKSKEEGKVPVLRMGNLQEGKLDWTNLVYTSDEEEIKKYELISGDLLFNRTNSPELVGKTSIYEGEREAIYAGYLIRVRTLEGIDSRFVNYFMNSIFAKHRCMEVKSDGVSQSNINAEKLGDFDIPLPPTEEQKEIVRILDKLLENESKIEELTALEKQIELIKKSILAKAFRGQLGTNSEDDESAIELLKEILNK